MRRPRRARKSPGRISRGEFIAGTEKRETTPRAEIFTLGRTDFKPVFFEPGHFCDCMLLSRYSTRSANPVL
jgi:hypothetical protein